MFAHHRLLTATVLATVLAVAVIAPVGAREAGPGPAASTFTTQEADVERDVKPVAIWALVGVGLFAAALGVLYLFKRELGGGEPKPGAWTAPITVIKSGDLPVEDSDFPGDDGADHGH